MQYSNNYSTFMDIKTIFMHDLLKAGHTLASGKK